MDLYGRCAFVTGVGMRSYGAALAFALCLLGAPQLSTAQFGQVSGTSAISFTQQGATVSPGTYLTIHYTLYLTGGSPNATSVGIVDKSYLAGRGITIQAYSGFVYPVYKGSVTVYVSNSTYPRTYNITFKAGGADPSQEYNFTLYVQGSGSAYTTVSSTSTSSSTSTTLLQQGSGNVLPAMQAQPAITTQDVEAIGAAVLALALLHFILGRVRHRASA